MDLLASSLSTLASRASERLRLAIRESEERSRQSEATLQRFRTALDASADMVFLIDIRRRRFIDFNESACRQLGYTREELLRREAELERDFEQLVASEERCDTMVCSLG